MISISLTFSLQFAYPESLLDFLLRKEGTWKSIICTVWIVPFNFLLLGTLDPTVCLFTARLFSLCLQHMYPME